MRWLSEIEYLDNFEVYANVNYYLLGFAPLECLCAASRMSEASTSPRRVET